MNLRPSDRAYELSARSRRRGLQRATVYPEPAVRESPIVAVAELNLRVGPTQLCFIVVDQRLVLCEGPHDQAGRSTAWILRDNGLVQQAVSLWRQTWELSTPVAPLNLSERALHTAFLLGRGHSDTEIARQTGVSTRSVERDVAALSAFFGVSTRAQIVAATFGRDAQNCR